MYCRAKIKMLPPLQGLLWLYLIFFGIAFAALQPGYLDFDNLPDTNFSCLGKVIGGYYADLETNCQMFHVCTIGQLDEPMDIRFLCLNGTVFDQETRVCERVDEVDCSKSEKFYSLNLELYGNTAPPIVEESHESELKRQSSTTTRKPTTSKPITTTTTPRPTTIRPTKFIFSTSSYIFSSTTNKPLTETNKPKVITSHHFPVSAPPDTLSNRGSLKSNSPVVAFESNKPISYQHNAFNGGETHISVTTHTTAYKSERIPLLATPNTQGQLPTGHPGLNKPSGYRSSTQTNQNPSAQNDFSNRFSGFIQNKPSSNDSPTQFRFPPLQLSTENYQNTQKAFLSGFDSQKNNRNSQYRQPEQNLNHKSQYTTAKSTEQIHNSRDDDDDDVDDDEAFLIFNAENDKQHNYHRTHSLPQKHYDYRATNAPRYLPQTLTSTRAEHTKRNNENNNSPSESSFRINHPHGHSSQEFDSRRTEQNPRGFQSKAFGFLEAEGSSQQYQISSTIRPVQSSSPRTEEVSPPSLQIPLPLIPFSPPAPFSLNPHIESKRHQPDDHQLPRIIISASASVSDGNGRKLNVTLDSIGPTLAHVIGKAPTSYDDYKEEDVGLDPFYHDVPKVRNGRNKRNSINDITTKEPTKEDTFDAYEASSTTTNYDEDNNSSDEILDTSTVNNLPLDYVDDNYEPSIYNNQKEYNEKYERDEKDTENEKNVSDLNKKEEYIQDDKPTDNEEIEYVEYEYEDYDTFNATDKANSELKTTTVSNIQNNNESVYEYEYEYVDEEEEEPITSEKINILNNTTEKKYFHDNTTENFIKNATDADMLNVTDSRVFDDTTTTQVPNVSNSNKNVYRTTEDILDIFSTTEQIDVKTERTTELFDTDEDVTLENISETNYSTIRPVTVNNTKGISMNTTNEHQDSNEDDHVEYEKVFVMFEDIEDMELKEPEGETVHSIENNTKSIYVDNKVLIEAQIETTSIDEASIFKDTTDEDTLMQNTTLVPFLNVTKDIHNNSAGTESYEDMFINGIENVTEINLSTNVDVTNDPSAVTSESTEFSDDLFTTSTTTTTPTTTTAAPDSKQTKKNLQHRDSMADWLKRRAKTRPTRLPSSVTLKHRFSAPSIRISQNLLKLQPNLHSHIVDTTETIKLNNVSDVTNDSANVETNNNLIRAKYVQDLRKESSVSAINIDSMKNSSKSEQKLTTPLLHRSAYPTESLAVEVNSRDDITIPLTPSISIVHTTPIVNTKRRFSCIGRALNRFYEDERDCRLFHYCSPGYSKTQVVDLKFVCDLGTFFDTERLKCALEKPKRCV